MMFESENIENNGMEEKLSRKSKKPLMEKRRRARINNCLLQLKSLVLQAMKKDATHYSKLEKADILEMTVKYLRSIQRRQITSAMAADPTIAAKYTLGYAECATEVARYLGSTHGVDDNVKNRVLNHITSCSPTSQSAPINNGPYPLQPLHVQIPHNRHDVMSLPSDRLLVSFPAEQCSDVTFQHGPYPPPHSDLRCESKTFEPVLIQNGQRMSKHSAFSTHQSNCDNFSSQSKFMDLIKDARLNNKSGMFDNSCFQRSLVTPSSVSALKDEPLWRPW